MAEPDEQKRVRHLEIKMMNKVSLFGAVMAATLLAVLAASPQQATAYTVKQLSTCEGWVGSPDDRFWILGFISGVNFAQDADHARGVEAKEIYKFVTKYCAKNPNHDLADATVAFISIHE
ncbi:MAG: hypothetical protein KUG59_01700 [Parvibaculaceae bacterium]|nr:hypothetical protein [Parvibaculaceae bacterium]